MLDLFYTAIIYLGFFQMSVWLYRTLCLVGRTFMGVKATPERYGKDSWAVVTGSTDGIGKAAAFNLARRGFNIVFVSRTLKKLEDCAKECEAHAKEVGVSIKTRIIQHDFAKNYSAKDFETMYEEHLKDLDISILLNNVGMASINDYHEEDIQMIHNIVACNVYSTGLLTKQIIKSFKKRHERNPKLHSLLMNTSAMACIVPVPGVATYSASKIYGDFLIDGLSVELAPYNVDTSCWRAAGVATAIIG
jgi:17beta-estradiol 17-dehydrogenase / very-long-chain 3-oxoacyl-CoA reductase